MKFNNRHNIPHKLSDGRIAWESRSLVVVPIIYAEYNGETYTPIVLRGKYVEATPNRWCAPCGYLDYDETLFDAARRELWEEAGLDLHYWATNQDNNIEPVKINSSIHEDKQNVSVYFVFRGAVSKLQTLTIENCEKGELEDCMWVSLKDLHKYNLAFNHDKIIQHFYEHINMSEE